MSALLTGITGICNLITDSVKTLVALSTPTSPTTTAATIQLPDTEMWAVVCADARPITYFDPYTGEITTSFEWVLV